MDYNGLRSLMEMAGPATSGWNAGVAEMQDQRAKDLAAILNEESIRAKQQEFGQNELMNPLKVRQQSIQNQGLEAELPGKRATSRKLSVDADVAEGTKDSKIATQLSDDNAKRLKARLDEGEAAFKLASQAAQYMGSGPDSEARKRQFLASGAVPPGPLFDAIMSTPAEELSVELGAMQQNMALLKDDYIKMLGQVRETGKETRKTRQMEIDAGRYAKSGAKSGDILAQVKAGKLSFERAATAFEVMAMYEDDPELKTQYLEQAKKFEQANLQAKAAAGAGKPDLERLGVPTRDIPPALGAGAPAAKPNRKPLSEY